MGIVYVVQEPVRRDEATGDLVPLFDISPAMEYGDIEFLLPPGNIMLSPQPMVNTLNTKLSKYTDNDFLLTTGDPAAIGVACAVAARHNRGRIQMLKWSSKVKRYMVLRINTNGGVYET